MKKWSLLSKLLLVVLVLSACQPAAPADQTAAQEAVIEEPTAEPTVEPTPVPTEEPTAVPEPIMTIVGQDGEKTFTMEDLMAMEIVEGQAGIKSSTGQIYPPALYRGVSLKTLLSEMGTIDETTGFNIVAEDGYGLAFSYDQIMNGNFVAYDPATGDELRNPVELDAILAFEREGQPLDKKEDGILRVVIISEKNNQVTDGHWSIKWVNRVELNSMVQDWAVLLTGAITENLDRSSFESCVNCHEASWTDDKGQVWTGTPLWRLMGYVDDEIAHEGLCYDNDLAEAGYEIELVAGDGYAAAVSSVDAHRNEGYVVANTVDGNPLPEKHFPLRLVGDGLEKSAMVSVLTNINLALDPIEAAEADADEEPVEAAADDTGELKVVSLEEGEITVTGLVEQEVGLTDADLRAWKMITITAEHPKKGEEEYDGVLLSDLFAFLGISPEATTLVLTADDGYQMEVPLDAVNACEQCILKLGGNGNFGTVMPGMETNTWIKGLVSIEVK